MGKIGRAMQYGHNKIHGRPKYEAVRYRTSYRTDGRLYPKPSKMQCIMNEHSKLIEAHFPFSGSYIIYEVATSEMPKLQEEYMNDMFVSLTKRQPDPTKKWIQGETALDFLTRCGMTFKEIEPYENVL